MMRSLYSGVAGLKNHQTKMDVIGNNIANVNTVGFKASRVTFQDIFSQTMAPASAPGATYGGVNPQQIGLGMNISTMDILFTRSASQYTGNMMDVMIDGDGFIITTDSYDNSVPATPVMGEQFYTRAGNLYLDQAQNLTTSNGNLVLGYGMKVDPNNANAMIPDESKLVPIQIIDPAPVGGVYKTYYNLTISKDGEVSALERETGNKQVFGYLAIATFPNQNALEKVGESMYRTTNNSGAAQDSLPGKGGSGFLKPGTLEMSNVDLSNEFTDMIVTQRGFQANSRIITVSDTMLEELVNLKR